MPELTMRCGLFKWNSSFMSLFGINELLYVNRYNLVSFVLLVSISPFDQHSYYIVTLLVLNVFLLQAELIPFRA